MDVVPTYSVSIVASNFVCFWRQYESAGYAENAVSLYQPIYSAAVSVC